VIRERVCVCRSADVMQCENDHDEDAESRRFEPICVRFTLTMIVT